MELVCIFMHRTIPVVKMDIDDSTGFITKIIEIYAAEHLPVGISVRNGQADRAAFNDWWTDRSIPASRSGIRQALEILDIKDTRMLLTRCFGLSLSDQYWICPENSDLKWEDINFFNNDFSDDIGDILFGEKKDKKILNFSSPDNTSDGNLKKRWKIIDGRRCLIKGGSNPFRQQPFNEVIACRIMELLDIPHISYSLMWDNGAPYSVCEDFIDEHTELVPAWRIMLTQKRNNSVSVYSHFVKCCKNLRITSVIPFLDRMIVLDYLIANEDRHFNNFGVLRNAETLEWIGPAPVYDSGSSLGYDKLSGLMNIDKEIVCKPFKNHHEEQIKLVSDYSWIDFSRLSGTADIIKNVFSSGNASDYIDEKRVNTIINGVEKRIKKLKEIAGRQSATDVDSIKDDVKADIAASYNNM